MAKISFICALLLCICLATMAHGGAIETEQRSIETDWWFGIPRRPFPHTLPPQPAQKLPPPMPYKDPSKCFDDVGQELFCMPQIIVSFWNRAIHLDPECCKAVQVMQDDCSQTIFGRFNNPFFELYLKNHCSSKPSPTPPKTPSTKGRV